MSIKKSAETSQEEKISVFSEITAALQEEIEQMSDWKPAPEGETPNGEVMQPRKEEKKKWDKKKKKKKNFDKKPTKPNGQQLPPDLPPLGGSKEGESSNLMAEKLKQMFAAKETDDGQKVYEVKDDFKRQQEEKERLKQEEREAKRRQKELERQQAEDRNNQNNDNENDVPINEGVSEGRGRLSLQEEKKEESSRSESPKPKLPTLDKPADERFDLSSFKKSSIPKNEEKSQASQEKNVAEAVNPPWAGSSLSNKEEHAPKRSETPSVPKIEPQESKQKSEPERRVEPKPDEHKHKVEPGQTVSLKSESPKNTNQQPETKKVEQPLTSSQETSDKVEPTESISSLVGDLLTGIQDGHSGKTKQDILHQAFHDTQPTEKRVLKPGQVIYFKKKN